MTPVIAPAQPVESLAGTLPVSGDYDEVLAAIDAVGASATSLTLYWDDLHKAGEYAADPDWPSIADAVYPSRDIRIQLTFAVIDTLEDRRPPELKHLSWDHPEVIDDFVAMAKAALSRMPNVDLLSIAIGNEVDGHLAGSQVLEYERFFEMAKAEIRAIRPGVPITVKATWNGLQSRPEIRELAQLGDALSITWYPMGADFYFLKPEEALKELNEMAEIAAGPWELSEVGYPSDGCGASSEENQAIFHTELARATQLQTDLTLVQRVWSHDISDEEVSAYTAYYDNRSPCFRAFLSSLGLRTMDDQAKPAFEALSAR